MNPGTSWKKLMLLAAALTMLVGVAACGSGNDDGESGSGNQAARVKEATLVLDFVPGAVHAGIYEALNKGYFEENGIDLQVIEPTSTADTLKLIDAGKAEFGIADGIDLAMQIADGREAQAIMAISQRPPGGLITVADEGITDPKQLEGETVGITGVPSDTAVLNTIMEDAGSSAGEVDAVTIGFNGVHALLSGKVKAFTGFIPADAVQVEANGQAPKNFPLDEYGGPSYPGLVAFSTESRIGEDPDLMQGFVDATVKGYRDALDDPAVAIDSLISQTQGINEQLATDSFAAWVPLFGPADTFGQFKEENLESLSAFMVENDLATQEISPDRYATTRFTQPAE